ncbi:MAG: acyl-CoA dehydrogenase family protein [Nannocystaceae bacterium]
MFDFLPNETQSLVQTTARGFAERELAPRAAQLDRDGVFPRGTLRRAAELGLLGINVPDLLGGTEAGAVAYSLAITELARACAATTVAICVSNMVAEVISNFGTSDQRAEHVPRLCSGEYIVGGFALSEAGAGSDPGSITTRAERTDSGWAINGAKLWITSGTDAGLFVVWARTNRAPGTRGLSAFLVPGDAPGVVRGQPEEKMGQHGSTTTSLGFVDVRLAPEALLGEEGKGFRVAMMALDGGRIGIASLALGVGRAAFDVALAYAQQRRQFSRPIASFQGIQWLLADSDTELDAASLMILRAAWLKQQRKAYTRAACMAKLYASEKSFSVCNRAIQILGGCGYAREYHVERYLRDVRVTSIYEGTSEIQRLVLARDIAKRFADRI